MSIPQQSSSTPITLTHLSVSLPLWACRHYLMSLSFCAAGVGGGGGGGGGVGGLKGLLLCSTSGKQLPIHSATDGHQSDSESSTLLSD